MICCVGLTCVDIVNFMPEYPEEDSDQRYFNFRPYNTPYKPLQANLLNATLW